MKRFALRVMLSFCMYSGNLRKETRAAWGGYLPFRSCWFAAVFATSPTPFNLAELQEAKQQLERLGAE